LIILDTQVWIWWSTGSERLSINHRQLIDDTERDGIAISTISIWEVAMLVSKGRLDLGESVDSWLGRVLDIPTLHLLPLSPAVLVESTRLPGEFHSDPADRIIVATARSMGTVLLTTDGKILMYNEVRTVGP